MKLFAAACVAVASLVPVAAQEVYKVGNGVSAPTIIRLVKAEYTEEAKAAHIEGNVVLEVVVRADGAVGDVKVVRSLDDVFGLDKQAVKAMRESTFKPAQKDGKAVAVSVQVETNFRLQ